MILKGEFEEAVMDKKDEGTKDEKEEISLKSCTEEGNTSFRIEKLNSSLRVIPFVWGKELVGLFFRIISFNCQFLIPFS